LKRSGARIGRDVLVVTVAPDGGVGVVSKSDGVCRTRVVEPSARYCPHRQVAVSWLRLNA
jgi:hypothetical protein